MSDRLLETWRGGRRRRKKKRGGGGKVPRTSVALSPLHFDHPSVSAAHIKEIDRGGGKKKEGGREGKKRERSLGFEVPYSLSFSVIDGGKRRDKVAKRGK